MQAVIIAGGKGTRLRPLTYDCPKPMLPLVDRPFLEWMINRCREAS
ncbi:MAG: sugar phosphate nucleotidyltransferase, partial [Pseudanabaena sp.]